MPSTCKYQQCVHAMKEKLWVSKRRILFSGWLSDLETILFIGINKRLSVCNFAQVNKTFRLETLKAKIATNIILMLESWILFSVMALHTINIFLYMFFSCISNLVCNFCHVQSSASITSILLPQYWAAYYWVRVCVKIRRTHCQVKALIVQKKNLFERNFVLYNPPWQHNNISKHSRKKLPE